MKVYLLARPKRSAYEVEGVFLSKMSAKNQITQEIKMFGTSSSDLFIIEFEVHE